MRQQILPQRATQLAQTQTSTLSTFANLPQGVCFGPEAPDGRRVTFSRTPTLTAVLKFFCEDAA